jgi:D-3-phosphoglycerate dehydrogenase
VEAGRGGGGPRGKARRAPGGGALKPGFIAVVADRFAKEGLDRLRQAGVEVVDAVGAAGEALHSRLVGAHALLVRSTTAVDAALLERATALYVVGRAGVGVENIDVAACDRVGVAVLNSPGASALTTAERTLALLFSMLHQVGASERMLRAGKWDRRSFMPTEACGKTLGVLGFGNIGRVVAAKAHLLGMRVLVHDRSEPAEGPFNLGLTPVGFDELFQQSDVVSLHVSASAKGLVTHRELQLMKPGGFLVNTSRGHVVDEAALVRALQAGHLKGAALDVFEREPLPADSPLRALENVVLSPHLGGTSAEAERRASLSVAENVARFLTEGRLINGVGRPAFFKNPLSRP